MMHSDDNGLVLPPRLAPFQVVIIPIYKSDDDLDKISNLALTLKLELESLGVSVKFDSRNTHKPGWKFAEYELKGVPVRLTLGSRDLENNTIELFRRDTMEKQTLDISNVGSECLSILDDIQENLYVKANRFLDDNTCFVDSYDEFKNAIDCGGFVYAYWDGTSVTEEKIKTETKATIRCIPLNMKDQIGECIYSGKKTSKRVLFAKSY